MRVYEISEQKDGKIDFVVIALSMALFCFQTTQKCSKKKY